MIASATLAWHGFNLKVDKFLKASSNIASEVRIRFYAQLGILFAKIFLPEKGRLEH